MGAAQTPRRMSQKLAPGTGGGKRRARKPVQFPMPVEAGLTRLLFYLQGPERPSKLGAPGNQGQTVEAAEPIPFSIIWVS